MKKKFDGNYANILKKYYMLFLIISGIKKSKGVRPLIAQTIQEGRTMHNKHWWRNKEEHITSIFYGLIHRDAPVLAAQVWAKVPVGGGRGQ